MKSYNRFRKLAYSDIEKHASLEMAQSPVKLKQLQYIISILINGFAMLSNFQIFPYNQMKTTEEKIVNVLLEFIEKIANEDIPIDF